MKVNARGFGIVLFVFGILMLSGCEDDGEKLDKAHKDAMNQLQQTHAKTIKDLNESHAQALEGKDSVIRALNKEIEKLRADKGDAESGYKTMTVVCIALGAAVIGALFVGTLMGAKSRRDALRVCKERRQTVEETS